jgi:hypothetical protein
MPNNSVLFKAMDPVTILKVGISGLIFFLALWAYRLIAREQGRSGAPRKEILRTIYIFLGANLLFAILVAVSGYLESAKLSRYRELMSVLANTVDQKVEYEAQQAQGSLSTLKPSIDALISTVKTAREEKLIDAR